MVKDGMVEVFIVSDEGKVSLRHKLIVAQKAFFGEKRTEISKDEIAITVSPKSIST